MTHEHAGRHKSVLLAQRVAQMFAGTVLMGVGVALLLLARFGLLPLDVLHAAVAARAGWTIGGAIIAVQAVLLMCYLPLRIRPGLGTVTASVIPAVTCDALIAILPVAHGTVPRLLLLAAGGTCFAIGTAAYLGAGLGSLPRDGLMLVVHQRRGYSLATIRIAADIACLLIGAVIIGPVLAARTGVLGVGSVLLALLLGPAIAWLLRTGLKRPAESRHGLRKHSHGPRSGPADTGEAGCEEDLGTSAGSGVRRAVREDDPLL